MKFQLIDAMNLFHATKHVVRGSADQKGGMAIHILFHSMAKIWNTFESDHVVIALEGGKTWRREYLTNYKGQRRLKQLERTQREVEDDEIFFEYLNGFVRFISERTNISVLCAEGCEADDMIARWIQLHENDQHVIISNDTDFYQLLAPNVTIYRPQQKQIIDMTSIIDSENDKSVNDKNGNPKSPPDPKWELFLKICKGDPTDNILPAIPPRTRETKIRAAFDDREGKGFDFNNLMLTEFDDPLTGKNVKTLDRYHENELLIDLTRQPPEIIERADQAIINAVQADPLPNTKIGHSFMRFCADYDLKRILDTMQKFTPMLTAKYGDHHAN